MSKQYFEFVAGNSAKFWEIETHGNKTTVRFGRIGTPGQTQARTFPSAEKAAQHAAKLIGQKTAKGYQQVAAA